MENKKSFVIALVLVLAMVMVGCATGGGGGGAAPTEPLAFNNVEIVPLQARSADWGEEGGAVYFSDAKTTLESGTYEILLERQRPVDARGYNYLEFEMMTTNLDLTDDIGGFFPRVRTGETYTQFNGSAAMNAAVATMSAENQWVTVTVPITSEYFHELGDNYRSVISRVDSLLLRFILEDMEPISGRIYLRNFRFIN